jgi:regulator of protease activity HflC (stomatin/prohibitin superfamily)
VRAELVDLRIQSLEIAGQEILTKDKVALRINLNAGARFVDVLGAYAQQAKPLDWLYRELQFGLRAAVGTRTLDELLEDKGAVDRSVAEHIGPRARAAGLEVVSVGVRDIILPGEMKTILARVVEAEKAAQANVIRRREETAATRSLLNTAKVMEDSPVALRLKELEALEKVTEKIDRISVFGGLEGVLKDLVKIRV